MVGEGAAEITTCELEASMGGVQLTGNQGAKAIASCSWQTGDAGWLW